MYFSLLSTDGGGGTCRAPKLCMRGLKSAVALAASKNSASKNRDREHGLLGGYLHDIPLASSDRRKWSGTARSRL
jgi:hypothetical protein